MKPATKADTKSASPKAQPATKAPQPAAKKPLSKAERSKISHDAALKAHATMKSKRYLAAKRLGRPAVAKYLANRAA
jgi:hypothetical protein